MSEISIVDTFTKLIFGQSSHYSNRELRIIQAFRAVDTRVVCDSHRDLGEYLRAMGVQEMIRLVARVQQQLVSQTSALPGARAITGNRALDRRAH